MRTSLRPGTTMTLEIRVREGARILDSVDPDWFEKIDLDKLDLSSDCNCILGQLFGSYKPEKLDANIEPSDFGFNLPLFHDHRQWCELYDFWRDQIIDRFEP